WIGGDRSVAILHRHYSVPQAQLPRNEPRRPTKKLNRLAPAVENLAHAVAIGITDLRRLEKVERATIAVVHTRDDEVQALRALVRWCPPCQQCGHVGRASRCSRHTLIAGLERRLLDADYDLGVLD